MQLTALYKTIKLIKIINFFQKMAQIMKVKVFKKNLMMIF